MNSKRFQSIFIFIAVVIFVQLVSCKKDATTEATPTQDSTATVVISKYLTLDPDTVNFESSGSTSILQVKMSGSKWTAVSHQSWCKLSLSTSNSTSVGITISVEANTNSQIRTALLTFVMDGKDSAHVLIIQAAHQSLYPDYSSRIEPDKTGMTSDAKVLAAQMTVGWNLGNSLEVPGDETAWGNPKATQALIDSVKASGVNAIRIPCAWDSYIENTSTCKLKASWLARVKEVVDYCYQNNMYVIINIHWDGGWLENNPTYAKQEAVNAKQKALWQQIAVYFRNYDEHLLFAGTNEVNLNLATPTSENIAVQLSYNQTFVSAVRTTGGKNMYRNLIVQAYNTNIDYAVSYLTMSTDSVANRLFAEVHYYDPWDFCGLEADASWATVKYLWGKNYAQYGTISSWGQEDYVQTQFKKMKTNFFDKGYPVILGEFGASRRSSLSGTALEYHLASRAYYFQYVAQQAKTFGLVPFIWDNGSTSNLGMGIFNRKDGSVFDRQALSAYIAGAKSASIPN